MFCVDYELKQCEFGLGVFTKQFIPKGATVFRMTVISVMTMSVEAFDRLEPAAQDHVRKYAYGDANTGIVYLPVLHDMFLNHSDDPNIRKLEGTEDDVAVRDIHPGEQIFCDYRELDTMGTFCSSFL